MYFATVLYDTLAHRADDARQFVTTDMRMCLVEDIIFGSKMMEEFHHALHIATFLATGVEFTIRESTSATFAKAVVGLGVKSLVAVECSDVFFTLGYLFSALVDDGFDAMLNQGQCRKQSCRTCAYDIDRMLGIMHVMEYGSLIERNRCILLNELVVVIG